MRTTTPPPIQQSHPAISPSNLTQHGKPQHPTASNLTLSETRSLGFGLMNKSRHSKQDNIIDDALFIN